MVSKNTAKNILERKINEEVLDMKEHSAHLQRQLENSSLNFCLFLFSERAEKRTLDVWEN